MTDFESVDLIVMSQEAINLVDLQLFELKLTIDS
jgi:hypothetical protein